ncbi:MAG: hypothetical protein NZM02_02975 [Patescibacteria group bacterium]|nr:hypothetical protein [Patescibacteria group bacterium]
MSYNFSKIILRWSLAFVLFCIAFLDLGNEIFFPKILDFYFIFLALWIFWGRKIIWSSYLIFITFAIVGVYKTFILGFEDGFLEIGYSLVSLALVDLVRRSK